MKGRARARSGTPLCSNARELGIGCHKPVRRLVNYAENETTMSQNPHYIVAGGGLAGLTSAIELALRGHRVALYEQSKTLGGRAATHRQQGYAMNIGPHGFYRAGLMKAQFDAWGIAYTGKTPLGKGSAYLISAGERHRFPASTAGLLTCGAFSLADKLRIGQIMGTLGRARANPGESMQAWIDRQSTSETVRAFLAAMTRLSTYAADADLLDAGAALHQIQMAIADSVLYLDGGWETVVNGLATKARTLGVEIHTDCGVVSAEPGAVELRGGERAAADGIVLALPPRAVEQLTGKTLPAMTPARAACLDLGLRRLPAKAGTFALGLDEPIYVSAFGVRRGTRAGGRRAGSIGDVSGTRCVLQAGATRTAGRFESSRVARRTGLRAIPSRDDGRACDSNCRAPQARRGCAGTARNDDRGRLGWPGSDAGGYSGCQRASRRATLGAGGPWQSRIAK
jgi:glycine/D-amino acid oxidase-like deaminating enzyme